MRAYKIGVLIFAAIGFIIGTIGYDMIILGVHNFFALLVGTTANGSINKDTLWTFFAAIGSCAVVFYAVLKEIILARYRRPILKSNFEMKNPYITKESNIAYWYHLEILNIGKSTATVCLGYMDEILKKDGDSFFKIEEYIPMSLRWVREKTDEPTILSPGQRKYLDIGLIKKDEHHKFSFCFNGFSDIAHLKAGSYKLKVVVYSENAKALTTWIEIAWTGQWSDDYDAMKKELIAKKSVLSP